MGIGQTTRFIPWICAAAAAGLAALILALIRRYRGKRGTPDSLMYSLIFFISALWLGGRRKICLEEERLREAEAPYILLCNHESFFDYYYLSKLKHPRRPSYLVNEYYCTRPVLRAMSRPAGIVSKKLFTRDMGTAVGILRTIRKGYPIVIFPEGRLSPDGRSNPIVEQGGALYKKMGADLVLVRLSGAYYAKPKWRKRAFRSRITVKVERVVKGEELRRMTAGEIDELIASVLYQDASRQTDQRYPRRDRAEGLENILYRCADCGALYTTRSAGSELFCTACGARHRLDEHYHFSDGAGTIPEYYDRIRALEAPGLGGIDLSARVDTRIFGANGGPVRREEGECRLTAEAFSYRSDKTDFSIPTAQMPALAFSCGEEFELYHEGELYYFYPRENPQQTARWGLLVDMLTAQRTGSCDRREKT